MSASYGYVRVSSRDQNEERQLIAMKEFGIVKSRIYMDKQSGSGRQRRYRRFTGKSEDYSHCFVCCFSRNLSDSFYFGRSEGTL